MNFDTVSKFEQAIADYYGAPHAVAVDCCTHAIELCLRYTDIIDAAVFWKNGSYIPETYMCLSFQFQKHLSLGRGGMILTDNKAAAQELKKMSYDGRIPDRPWRDQDINSMGYHYYMTPETAALGLKKLPTAIAEIPRQWTINNWPDLRKMDVFK